MLDLAQGTATEVSAPSDSVDDVSWATDGTRVVSIGGGRLAVYSLVDGERHGVDVPSDTSTLGPSLSPDGRRAAFGRWVFSPVSKLELHVVDLASGADTVVTDDTWPDQRAEWSPDGTLLTYTSAADKVTVVVTCDGSTFEEVRVRPHAAVYEFRLAQARLVADSGMSFAPAFDPGGGWLSFVDVSTGPGGMQESVVAEAQPEGLRHVVAGPTPVDAVEDHRLQLHTWRAPGHLSVALQGTMTLADEVGGEFELKGVRLDPGQNALVAIAADPSSGLVSDDSAAVLVTTASDEFADLALDASGVSVTPGVPTVGHPTVVAARVENLGARDAEGTTVRLTVTGPPATAPIVQEAQVTIPAGKTAVIALSWTPSVIGSYRVLAEADPSDTIVEAREDNNQVTRDVLVQATTALTATIESDRNAYPARAPVVLRVEIDNGGAPFAGTVTTTVEDGAGHVVATVDARALSLAFGSETDYVVGWTTGTVFAGDYSFHVRARATEATADTAQAAQAFTILPDVSVFGRVVPDQPTVAEGATAGFAVRVESRGANLALAGAHEHLQVTPLGTNGPPLFEADAEIPVLLPGGVWESRYDWTPARPIGSYTATFEVRPPSAPALAAATATVVVAPAAVTVTGTLGLVPGEVLAGTTFNALVAVTNVGATPLASYPVAVEVRTGATGALAVAETLSLDLLPGQTRQATVPLSTAALAPAAYPVFLKGGPAQTSLDRARLGVHGLVAPPTIDTPAHGSRVDASHPVLSVNDGSIVEGAPLTYEFEVYADPELTQQVTSIRSVAETAVHTTWRVDVNLTEDRTFYWRARATDGFLPSAWTAVAAFTVDAVNLPPGAPVPDAPRSGERVANRQPILTVTNALDVDRDVLTYEFRVASDPEMTVVLASAGGLEEGLGLTSWTVPVLLDEDATYYWSARARDGHATSAWTDAVAFTVDSVNETPTAPTPRRPIGGESVPTPTLVVGNAQDAERDALHYRFQIDSSPTFASPDLQVSPDVAEGTLETAWTPPLPLMDNILYYWRAAATDGHTTSPFAGSSFFMNLANDPPGIPVLLDPVDGRAMRTATPVLRLRNTTDADRDAAHVRIRGRGPVGPSRGPPPTCRKERGDDLDRLDLWPRTGCSHGGRALTMPSPPGLDGRGLPCGRGRGAADEPDASGAERGRDGGDASADARGVGRHQSRRPALDLHVRGLPRGHGGCARARRHRKRRRRRGRHHHRYHDRGPRGRQLQLAGAGRGSGAGGALDGVCAPHRPDGRTAGGAHGPARRSRQHARLAVLARESGGGRRRLPRLPRAGRGRAFRLRGRALRPGVRRHRTDQWRHGVLRGDGDRRAFRESAVHGRRRHPDRAAAHRRAGGDPHRPSRDRRRMPPPTPR